MAFKDRAHTYKINVKTLKRHTRRRLMTSKLTFHTISNSCVMVCTFYIDLGTHLPQWHSLYSYITDVLTGFIFFLFWNQTGNMSSKTKMSLPFAKVRLYSKHWMFCFLLQVACFSPKRKQSESIKLTLLNPFSIAEGHHNWKLKWNNIVFQHKSNL